MSAANGNRKTPFTTLETGTVVFLIAAALLVILPSATNYAQQAALQQQVDECRVNIRRIAEGLDHYFSAKREQYPRSLQGLIPHYLKEIPRCPSTMEGEKDSDRLDYGYQVSPDMMNYTVYCKGHRHEDAGLDKNRPAWSREGKWR